MWCIYFCMTKMRYRKALTITNMQIIITKIRFWSGQGGKIRCDVLIGTGIWKPINITGWGEIALHQVSSRLLAITFCWNWGQWELYGRNSDIVGSVDSAPYCTANSPVYCLLSPKDEFWKLWWSGLEPANLLPPLLNWLGRQPPLKGPCCGQNYQKSGAA